MSSQNPAPVDWAVERYRTLLEVAEAVAGCREVSRLSEDLARRLPDAVDFDFISIALYDPGSGAMKLRVLRLPGGQANAAMDIGMKESPEEWVWERQQPLVVCPLEGESRFAAARTFLRQHEVQSCCWTPLTSGEKRLGVMSFGSTREEQYPRSRIEFLMRLAGIIAEAVDSAASHESAAARMCELAAECDSLRVLLETRRALAGLRDPAQIFLECVARIRTIVRHEYAEMALYDEEKKQLHIRGTAISSPIEEVQIAREMTTPAAETPAGEAVVARRPIAFSREALASFPSSAMEAVLSSGVQRLYCVPLIGRAGVMGTLSFGSTCPAAFSTADAETLAQAAADVASVLDGIFAPSREPASTRPPGHEGPAIPVTLQDADREHILRALQQTAWVIGGPRGAAALLGLKRTTLQSKMKKLGIARTR